MLGGGGLSPFSPSPSYSPALATHFWVQLQSQLSKDRQEVQGWQAALIAHRFLLTAPLPAMLSCLLLGLEACALVSLLGQQVACKVQESALQYPGV